jgi:hypothetical protein
VSYHETAILANIALGNCSEGRSARQPSGNSDFDEVVDRWFAYQEKQRREMAAIWESVPKDSLVDFLRMCAKSALLKIDDTYHNGAGGRSHWTSISNRFADIVENKLELLQRVCAATPQDIKKVIELRDEISRLDQLRAEWRKRVADELKAANRKKKNALCEFRRIRRELVQLSARVNHYAGGEIQKFGFPPIPEETIPFDGDGTGLPAASGVYFAWRNGIVEYVGRSVNLNARCRSSHHALCCGDALSYVHITKSDLNFAEYFYIGVLRPVRNFGNGWKGQL